MVDPNRFLLMRELSIKSSSWMDIRRKLGPDKKEFDEKHKVIC